jgi:hypothetical protein
MHLSKRAPILMLLFFLAAGRAVACDAKPGDTSISAAFLGGWKEVSGDRLLNIEPDRMILAKDGDLIVRGLIRPGDGCLTLRRNGLSEAWTATLSDGLLRLESKELKAEELAGTYRRLDHVPAEARLEPLPLASPAKLPLDRIQAVQAEIADRFQEDQALRKSSEKPLEKIRRKSEDDRVYLRHLLGDVGWIDSSRFGAQTSVHAVVLAKHTGDLRLMLTILPFAERDLRNAKDGQTFAILYDALQLDLGRKQLYGTQLSEDAQGPFVLPMEESREKVNERLKRLGLPDLDEYLSVASQALYSGSRTVESHARGSWLKSSSRRRGRSATGFTRAKWRRPFAKTV